MNAELFIVRRGDRWQIGHRSAQPFVWDMQGGVVELRSYVGGETGCEVSRYFLTLDELRGKRLVEENAPGRVLYIGGRVGGQVH